MVLRFMSKLAGSSADSMRNIIAETDEICKSAAGFAVELGRWMGYNSSNAVFPQRRNYGQETEWQPCRNKENAAR